MNLESIRLFIVGSLVCLSFAEAKTRVVGYYENDSIYNGQELPGYAIGTGYATTPNYWNAYATNGKIDAFNYAFAVFNDNIANGWQNNGYYPTNDWLIHFSDSNDVSLLLPQAYNLRTLDTRADKIKIILSLGGYNFNSSQPSAPSGYGQYGYYTYPFFSMMVADEGIPSGNYSDPTNRYATQRQPNQGTRSVFVNSCLAYCGNSPSTGQAFDGIDIDWEFPGRTDRGGADTDYQGLITTLVALRTALPLSQGKVLTMATPSNAHWAAPATMAPFTGTSWVAGSFSDGYSYPGYSDITAVNPTFFEVQPGEPYANEYEKTYFCWLAICGHELDWFNVETYDYYGSQFPAEVPDPVNSELAPLYATNSAGYNSGGLCANLTLDCYLSAIIPPVPGFNSATISIPANKICMGIPAYGRGFDNGSGATIPGTPFTTGNPTPGQPYSEQEGYLNYYEIIAGGVVPNATVTNVYFNYDTQTSYANNPTNGYFISFDYAGNTYAPNAVDRKCQYILDKGLGGVMIWALDTDDVLNGFPVLQSVVNYVNP